MPFNEERLNLPLRLRVLQWSLAAVFLVLATAFWYFQVARHQQFLEMAENNHQRALPLAAPRGVLFDRGGKVLVENRFAFNISIVREQAHDVARTAQSVADLTGIAIESITEALERSKRLPAYRPVVVIRDATEAQIASVAAHRLELPGVVVVDWAGFVRQRPNLLQPDGVHATSAGYKARAELYAAGIRRCAS